MLGAVQQPPPSYRKRQVLTVNKRIAVVGGMNMDIGGSADGELRLRDSNPGRVTLRPGGVGRNIAHDLRLLGAEVSLLSAVGDDPNGKALLASCEALGMDVSLTLVRPRERSSTYLYVTDDSGDMLLGIADMEITDRITPAALAPLVERLNGFDAVVLDANLSEAALEYLAQELTSPLYADPVSTAKAPKLRKILPRLAALKPNRLEAQTLTGQSDPELAARALLDSGVQRVFLSLGGEGLLAADREQMLRLPAAEARVVNTTGAGDAAMAALVWAGAQGFGLEESARAALLAGAMTTECREANNPRLGELVRSFSRRT